MTASRFQHLISAVMIFTIAGIVTWLSFTQEPVEAFLFPRVISVFFIGLAAWNLVRAATGMAKVGGGIPFEMFRNFLPGLIVMVVYVFFAAKLLGFYVSSALAFLTVYSLYDPAHWFGPIDWAKRVIITAAFMAVIYCLFALVLQVQTPRGLFI